MATTHNARRRQRPARRTAPAHARPHRTHTSAVGTRQNRSVTTSNATPARAPVEIAAPAVTKTVRAVRAPDSDDHLAAYFRQLAEHELLSPEDERELSQGIEDTEILTWERVLSRADAVRPLLAMVEPNLEQPVKFPKLQKILDDML